MVVIADSLAIENPASARRKTLNWPCGGQRAPEWSEIDASCTCTTPFQAVPTAARS